MQTQIDNLVRDIHTNLARAARPTRKWATSSCFWDATARLLPPSGATCWPDGPRMCCCRRRYAPRGDPGTLAGPVHQIVARGWMPSLDLRRTAGIRVGLGNMGARGGGTRSNGLDAIAITQNTHPRGPETAPVALTGHRT